MWNTNRETCHRTTLTWCRFPNFRTRRNYSTTILLVLKDLLFYSEKLHLWYASLSMVALHEYPLLLQSRWLCWTWWVQKFSNRYSFCSCVGLCLHGLLRFDICCCNDHNLSMDLRIARTCTNAEWRHFIYSPKPQCYWLWPFSSQTWKGMCHLLQWILVTRQDCSVDVSS